MIEDEKKALRREAAERRAALARAAAPDIGETLADRFLAAIPLPPAGAAVSAFWSMGAEIDVRPLLRRLDRGGYRCCLPVTVKRGLPLVFRRWTPATTLVDGGFGTSIPPADAPVVVPELVIVPLLAFDREGYRLGYGGGFYDRTLAELRATGKPLAVGVGYAGQEVDRVPRTDYDQRLDWMVTEHAALRIDVRQSARR
jgi:5-formyltetrahydrofolate cyclo-ligase